ncbi:hypothetical protein Cob_v000580 [Colletotrichum orbiculare MAFF 240422]|uniref:Uncharacterized protein n=1 Tax=Colletotrichum orbiculare (strain 104-T / ATCC 96160 / CBS 514.97 / LARS 414 / MAFF 240422) TaxID=1213857 RepID=A0A484G9H8_COLOR|nr:hypothetical protein Cob_v000580 [Colletotrichum orbiculare MAFF 240422]
MIDRYKPTRVLLHTLFSRVRFPVTTSPSQPGLQFQEPSSGGTATQTRRPEASLPDSPVEVQSLLPLFSLQLARKYPAKSFLLPPVTKRWQRSHLPGKRGISRRRGIVCIEGLLVTKKPSFSSAHVFPTLHGVYSP